MLLYLFLLFTVIPLIELYLLYSISSEIGFWWTLAIVLGTGFVGATVSRWQGLKVLMRIERRMSRGQMPADELFDGAMLLVAGCLLITPGVLTDVVGLLLLVPPFRVVLRRAIKLWAARNVQIRVSQFSTFQAATRPTDDDPNIVEGDIVRKSSADQSSSLETGG